MKIKPFYIYIGVVAAAIVFLIIFSTVNTDKAGLNGKMPQDAVHQGLKQGQGPSAADLSADIKNKMSALKSNYEKNPDDTLNAREYAEFLAAAHRPEVAIEIYENILKKAPKRTDIRFSLGLIYYERRDFNKAEELVNSVLGYDRNNVQAKYNLGAIASSRGDIAKARAIWQDIVKNYPKTEFATMAAEAIQMSGAK
ncbi:MAG: tetratricopeptide repeat protein [Ignavibacteria bacterium]|jgi:tetratricopeptide (TPR) repeat protein|nr:tetratricopeptide repeat protein [Ignavibacteria bacterium]MCU7518225.1 tetratricopeptide repeat protein [Ignavibacteria bacterium]